MTLKQLQAEWRGDNNQPHPQPGTPGYYLRSCADALTIFILQQERDLELIRELADSIHFANWTKARSALYVKACERLKEMEYGDFMRVSAFPKEYF